MELDKDFRQFIELLNEFEVKYLVIGGYAVNFHGYPRYTKDIDFWLWMTKENIQKLLQAIRKFGFGAMNLEVSDFMTPENIIQLGYEPYRIDILRRFDRSRINFWENFTKIADKWLLFYNGEEGFQHVASGEDGKHSVENEILFSSFFLNYNNNGKS